MAIRPIGPGVPPALQPLLNEMRDASNELTTPTLPHLVFACLKAELPPAADYQNCFVMVTDTNIPVFSDGTTWRRFDTGVAV